jgi:hypothetical protein
LKFVRALPEARPQPGQIGCSQSGRFDTPGPDNGKPEDVGLEPAEEIVGRRARGRNVPLAIKDIGSGEFRRGRTITDAGTFPEGTN